ncbi:MAG: hypothetical protein Q9191_005763 [Dirinaria sp. TL-2023a]
MDLNRSPTWPSDDYDYIIVGGGTAGLVVACRLAEVGDYRVLVLEAGGNHIEDPRINIPAGWSAVLGSEVDWNFRTASQDSLNHRKVRHPQGKVLGGSSAINAEAFIAPSKADLDHWGSLGNAGWNWQSMIPYYRKFHTLNVPSDADTKEHLGLEWVDNDFRGSSGPIQASFQGVVQDPLSKAWVQTFKTLEHGLQTDPFSGEAVGGYSNPISVDPETKTRSYAANSYLTAAAGRSNLTVVTNAVVQKIVLEATASGPAKAKGVLVSVQGATHTIATRREVILAAGAFQSPKILELSGIGDPKILEDNNIPVIVENPNVGENLQDHLMTGISFEVIDGVFTGDSLMRHEPEATQGAMQMYTTARAGPLCAGGIGSYAFLPLADTLSPKSKSTALEDILRGLNPDDHDQDRASHEKFVRSVLASQSTSAGSLFMFPAQVNLHSDPDAKDFLQDLMPGSFLSLGVALLHPLSRGSVHINSSDAAKPPVIDPQYLSHPLDVEIMAHYVLFLEKLAATEPLASFLKPDGKRNHPTARHINDLASAKDYVRATAISNNHPACTCAMKPREQGGVVNERLLVHGTANLRVVDASIMPTVPGGNIQTSVYAVAERAADIIKADHQ